MQVAQIAEEIHTVQLAIEEVRQSQEQTCLIFIKEQPESFWGILRQS